MFNKILLVSLLLLGFVSCVEKQNFDQLDDLNITPTIEGSILYIEAPEVLINQSTDTIFYSQDFNFDGFSEDVFSERVVDGFVYYEIENTTSKELEVTVEFLDDEGGLLDIQSFHIVPAPMGLDQREVAYGSGSGKSIEIIKNTSSIKVFIRNLGDNSSLSKLPDPKIIFRSRGEFKIELR
ncbi:hypothetical protein KCTC52924_02068 [Arenibacter antarcticus]|uniref:Uncharacterized protein n=1 Tax=Arenibacter antarcticus TaxID=2040469 RepID=A0ABW5VG08_9FLAO|nr:hypothetical protein [Arenibacter sp. H213]MCM4168493.1 hypothetical protein [Arenibacter sp. H213]